MKNMYRLIINVYDEIETKLAETGPTFAVDYAKEEVILSFFFLSFANSVFFFL
ncbi:unnamed protein product [Linum tenue]|nr:unnamed protein product [Linum tenue]